jgi:hypothetical protein
MHSQPNRLPVGFEYPMFDVASDGHVIAWFHLDRLALVKLFELK